MTANKYADITINKKLIAQCPILKPTLGRDVLKVGLLQKSEYFTYDPGLTSTASCQSAITFINGSSGKLLYRGYAIEDLASHCNFLEVCYLLLNGELPNPEEQKTFLQNINDKMILDSYSSKMFQSFPRSSHPMAMLTTLISSLSTLHHEENLSESSQRFNVGYQLLAKTITFAAMCYRHIENLPFVTPDPRRNFVDNFLHMMFSESSHKNWPNPVFVEAMEKILILHADHEQNASTTTVRTAGSTGADPYVSIASGIGALWGPAHGGANEACLNMIQEIGSTANIKEYIKRAKDPDDSFRLMGFGHRVYKNYDPRAKVVQKICHKVLAEVGHDPLFELALELERIALEDPYFIDKKLYPNVDFYSGITLKAMGIPTSMFTVIFAVGRMIGWISHWKEMVETDQLKITRPRQCYMGHKERKFPKKQPL
jgi:citrate synthase